MRVAPCVKVEKFETLYSAAILSLMGYLDGHMKARIVPFADSLQNRGLEDVAVELFGVFEALKRSVVEDKQQVSGRFFQLFETLASSNQQLQAQLLDEQRKQRDLAAELRSLQQAHNYQTVKLTKLFQNSTFLNFVQSERKKQMQSSSIYKSDLFDSQLDEQIYRLQEQNMKIKESRAKLEEAIFLVESAFQTEYSTVDKQEMTVCFESAAVPSYDAAVAHQIGLLEADLERRQHEVRRLQKLIYTIVQKEIPGLSANNAETVNDEFVQVMNSVFEHVGIADRLEEYAATGQFDQALQESIQAQIAQRFRPSQLSALEALGGKASGTYSEQPGGFSIAQKPIARQRPGLQSTEPAHSQGAEAFSSGNLQKRLTCNAETQTKQTVEQQSQRAKQQENKRQAEVQQLPARQDTDASDDLKDSEESSEQAGLQEQRKNEARVKLRKRARRSKTLVLGDAAGRAPKKSATVPKIVCVESQAMQLQADSAKDKENQGITAQPKSSAADLKLQQVQAKTPHSGTLPLESRFATADRRLFPSPHEESTKPVKSNAIQGEASMIEDQHLSKPTPPEAAGAATAPAISELQKHTEKQPAKSICQTVQGSYIRSKQLFIDYKNKIMMCKPSEEPPLGNHGGLTEQTEQCETGAAAAKETQTDDSFFAQYLNYQAQQHDSPVQVSTLRLQFRDNNAQTTEWSSQSVNIAQTSTQPFFSSDKSTTTEPLSQDQRCVSMATGQSWQCDELVCGQQFQTASKQIQVCTCDCRALSQTKVYLQHVLRQNDALEQVCGGLESALLDERRQLAVRNKAQQILRGGKLEAQQTIARGDQQPLVKNEADILRKQVMLEFASRYNANK